MILNTTTTVLPRPGKNRAGLATEAEAPVEGKSTMNTNENTQVEKGMEIARTVAKGGETFSAEAKKLARDFLKRKRDQRDRVLPTFVEKLGDAMHVPVNADEHGLEALRRLVNDALAHPLNGVAPADALVLAHNAQIDTAEAIGANAQQPEIVDDEAIPPAAPEAQEKASAAVTPHIGIRQLDEALQQAEGRHLGDLCGWSIPGSRSKAEVDALATECGLADDFRFPKLTPNSCYRKAIQQVFNLGKKDHGKAMAVVVEDSAERIVHSIVTSRVVDDSTNDTVSAHDAAFRTEFKVGFDKVAYREGASAEACLVLEDPTNPLTVQLKDTYMELAEKYLSYDIRVAFQAAFRVWDACPVLPHGGLWYIPANRADKVRAWNRFMTGLGLVTAVIPCFDTAETIESLRQSTRNGLEAQLDDVLSLLDLYAQEGLGTVRTSTLEKRAEEFDELRSRAELYQAILGTTVDDLTAKITSAAQRLTSDISQRKADEEVEAEREEREKEEAKAARREERRAAKASASTAA